MRKLVAILTTFGTNVGQARMLGTRMLQKTHMIYNEACVSYVACATYVACASRAWIPVASASRRCVFLITFFLLLTLPTYAQDGSTYEDDILDLGTLYVEDTLLEIEEVIDRPTAFATVIDPRQLSRRSLTLPDVLETTPGVTVRSFGGLGSLSTISIRGLGSENVLVLLDGIPLNPTGGSVDLSDIPLDSLERIEIIRGGEGALTGSGAVGGIVRLTSIQAEEAVDEFTSGRISLGSYDTLTGGFTWIDPGDIFHFEFAGSRGDFDFLNNNGTQFDLSDDFNDTRENNEYSSVETRYGHTWDLGEVRTIGASVEYFRAEKGIPGITTFPSPNASQTDNRFFFHSNYTDPGFNDGQLDLSMSWLRQGRHYSDPLGESTGVPLYTSWIHNRLDLQSQWTGIGLSDEDVLTWGASLARETLDADEYGNPSRDNLALWLRDEWYHPSGAVLTGAVRSDWIDGDATISPHAGIRYPLNDDWTCRSNFSYNFRPPGFEELYRNEGLVVGNTDLMPERTLSFDIGVTHTSDRVRFEAAYFNLQTQDMIDYLLISGFRWKPYNIGRIRSSGFELSADWLIDSEWDLRSNYTRTRAVDTSGDPTRQGMPLAGVPSSEFFTELSWHCNEWEAFANWERRGASPITPSGTRFLPMNSTVGLGLGYSLNDTSTLMLEARNLLDEDLSDIRGFPLPGRSLFLTWSSDW